jgi:hypothetical protein
MKKAWNKLGEILDELILYVWGRPVLVRHIVHLSLFIVVTVTVLLYLDSTFTVARLS